MESIEFSADNQQILKKTDFTKIINIVKSTFIFDWQSKKEFLIFILHTV